MRNDVRNNETVQVAFCWTTLAYLLKQDMQRIGAGCGSLFHSAKKFDTAIAGKEQLQYGR